MSKDKYPNMFSVQMEVIVFTPLEIFFLQRAQFWKGSHVQASAARKIQLFFSIEGSSLFSISGNGVQQRNKARHWLSTEASPTPPRTFNIILSLPRAAK